MWPKFAEIIAEIEISKSKMAENIFMILAGLYFGEFRPHVYQYSIDINPKCYTCRSFADPIYILFKSVVLYVRRYTSLINMQQNLVFLKP